jgi:hypothetical protein
VRGGGASTYSKLGGSKHQRVLVRALVISSVFRDDSRSRQNLQVEYFVMRGG